MVLYKDISFKTKIQQYIILWIYFKFLIINRNAWRIILKSVCKFTNFSNSSIFIEQYIAKIKNVKNSIYKLMSTFLR